MFYLNNTVIQRLFTQISIINTLTYYEINYFCKKINDMWFIFNFVSRDNLNN